MIKFQLTGIGGVSDESNAFDYGNSWVKRDDSIF